jgi:hypothetical protein
VNDRRKWRIVTFAQAANARRADEVILFATSSVHPPAGASI